MNSVVVCRNGQQVTCQPDTFWSLCVAGQVQRSDQIFDWAGGQFLNAGQFPDVEPYLPPRSSGEIIEDILTGVLAVGTGFVLAAGAVLLLESILGTPEPAKQQRSRTPNYEPLEARKKNLVRARDGEICHYCGCHDPYGHVDHKTSRANGGSNLFRNLVWACGSCNCSKGRMNAPQFENLIWIS
jgi:hypothetical protein